jgi:hypothetical protein
MNRCKFKCVPVPCNITTSWTCMICGYSEIINPNIFIYNGQEQRKQSFLNEKELKNL